MIMDNLGVLGGYIWMIRDLIVLGGIVGILGDYLND
jgi:hypothetical protein